MTTLEHRRGAGIADLLAIPAEERFHELLDGELVRKAAPGFRHSRIQQRIARALSAFDDDGDGAAGRWVILAEVEIELGKNIFRPDLVGWRVERLVGVDVETWPMRLTPDWVCEVLSPGHKGHDRVKKFRRYAEAGIAHYWMVDPQVRQLEVYALENGVFQPVVVAGPGEVAKAVPFDALDFDVDRVLAVDVGPPKP